METWHEFLHPISPSSSASPPLGPLWDPCLQATEWHSGYQLKLWPEPDTEETMVVVSRGGCGNVEELPVESLAGACGTLWLIPLHVMTRGASTRPVGF